MINVLRITIAFISLAATVCQSAPADKPLSISAATSEYQTFVDWSNFKTNAYRHSQLDGAMATLRQDLPLENDLLDSIQLEWEGDPQSRECSDVRQFAHVTVRPDVGTAIIRFCLRTYMYLLEFNRAPTTALIFFPAQVSPESKSISAFGAIERNLKYLSAIATKDNQSGLPYPRFCTTEYVLHRTEPLGRELQDCLTLGSQPSQVAALSAWYASANGAQTQVAKDFVRMSGSSSSEEMMRVMYYEFFPGISSSIIYSALMHEVGHIKLCHHGSIGKYKCSPQENSKAKFNPKLSPELKKELEADEWAARKILEGWKDKNEFDQLRISAVNWLFNHRIVIGLSHVQRQEQLQERLDAQNEIFKSLNNSVLDLMKTTLPFSPSITEAMRNSINTYTPKF